MTGSVGEESPCWMTGSVGGGKGGPPCWVTGSVGGGVTLLGDWECRGRSHPAG